MNRKRLRGVRATANGMLLLRKAKGSFEDGPLTYSNIEEKTHINAKTVGRLFCGKRIDRANALAIIQLLGLSEKDVLFLEEFLAEESINKIESSDTGSSESARQLITGIETALNTLDRDQETDLQVMDWLKANRRSLAQEAAGAVLGKHSRQAATGTSVDESGLDQFSQEIRKHLQVLYCCLEVGSWEFIDGAIKNSSLPVNRRVEDYTEALSFIKDQKLSQDLPPKAVQTMTLLLKHLINILADRF